MKIAKASAKWLCILVTGALIVALALFWFAAHHDPYPGQKVAPEDVPAFQEIKLTFIHRYEGTHALPFMGGALIDLWGDGRDAVFIGGGRDQQDGLFLFEQGVFLNISMAAQVSQKHLPDATYGASSMDMDGDGKTDLVIARDSGVYLVLNEGGRFGPARKLALPLDPRSTALSVTLGDLDHDGLPDMYVSAYLKKSAVESETVFNKAGYGATSLLLHNEGKGLFKDITREAGVHQVHNTFTAVFADLDDDGWLDLVVAQDTGHLYTYRNLGNGTFQDMPQPARLEFAYPMGLALADVSGQGRLDIWASNVGGLPDFAVRGDLRPDQTLNKDWILLRNEGGFTFTDQAQARKLARYEFSWGGVFRDFNLDGREDLSVSESYIGLLPHKLFPLPGRLLVQAADGTFAPSEKPSGVVNRYFGISPLVADFNDDGAPDLLQLNLDGPVRVFLSAKPSNHFLKFRLPDSAAFVPSKVVVEMADGRKHTKWNLNGEGLCTDQSNEIMVGLGSDTLISNVVVTPPHGAAQTLHPHADTTLVIH